MTCWGGACPARLVSLFAAGEGGEVSVGGNLSVARARYGKMGHCCCGLVWSGLVWSGLDMTPTWDVAHGARQLFLAKTNTTTPGPSGPKPRTACPPSAPLFLCKAPIPRQPRP